MGKAWSFIGPGRVHFELLKNLGSVVYRIQLVRKHLIVHQNSLKNTLKIMIIMKIGIYQSLSKQIDTFINLSENLTSDQVRKRALFCRSEWKCGKFCISTAKRGSTIISQLNTPPVWRYITRVPGLLWNSCQFQILRFRIWRSGTRTCLARGKSNIIIMVWKQIVIAWVFQTKIILSCLSCYLWFLIDLQGCRQGGFEWTPLLTG